ncbi:hypothetical protein BH10PSE18_BH10PSE18_15280 [soil metagenome]
MLVVGGTPDAAYEDAALAAFGLQADRPTPTPHRIWPENMHAAKVFEFMQTQWQVAPAGGVVGLRYEVLPFAFDVCGVPREREAEVARGIQVMEAAAVEHINRKN